MLNAFYCFPTNTDYIKTPSYPMWLSVKSGKTHIYAYSHSCQGYSRYMYAHLIE